MLKVREAFPQDLEFIVKAQVAMAFETESMNLNESVVTKGCRAVIEDPNKGTYWMVESEGGLVGMCLTIPEWSDWRNGTVLWIHSVYTLPEFRGKGVFATLYAYLKKMVSEGSDLRGLRLYVDRRNESAKAVYEKIGMSADHYELYEWMKGT